MVVTALLPRISESESRTAVSLFAEGSFGSLK